ncbi:MAG: septum formation initiator family protein [Hyphomonadaceae bacterium]|nr:septum formation initiator family protein [Hyphomonadaceae bacterium]
MAQAGLRRAVTGCAVIVIILLAVGLYRAKSDAARTEADVRALERQIAETEDELRALRAEIAHLESPQRVETLARQHLDVAVGSEAAALPEDAMDRRLPAPRSP